MIRLFEKKRFVAIDYDRVEVRLVVFDYIRNAPVIRSVHIEPVTEGVDVTDVQAMGQFLRTVVDKLHLRGSAALMCVGRASAVLKSLQLPAASSADELISMVRFQASKELPFSAEEAVIDFTHAEHFDATETEAPEEGVSVLAAAVRLPIVDAAQQICAAAGLKLRRLGLRPYANLRAVYKCTRCADGERILLVSVSADEVEIDVMRDEMLEFSRAATIAPSAPDERADGDGRAATIRRAVMEVSRSLQSFLAMQGGGEVNACLVAGATGMEEEIRASLAKRMSASCELFDPSAGFGLKYGRAISGFGAALGLAAGQAADALPFDFINPKRPAPPRDTRRTKTLAIAAGVMFLIGGVWLARHAYLGGRQTSLSKLKDANGKLVTENKQLKRLEKQVKALEDWRSKDVGWLDQLAHLSNTLPAAERVYLTSLQCNPSGVISISGRARDNRDLTAFQSEQMNREGYKIRPKGSSPIRDAYGYPVQFTLDIEVSPEAKPVIESETFIGRPSDDDAGRGRKEEPERPRTNSRRRTGGSNRGRSGRRRR